MQVFLGAVVVLATALILAARLLHASGRRIIRPVRISARARRTLAAVVFASAAVLAVPSVVPQLRSGFLAFCGVCPVTAAVSNTAPHPGVTTTFLLACWYYAATVLPVFVLASLVSGLLMTRWRRMRPRGPVAAFLVAAALPVCSCGVIPVARSMLDSGSRGVRSALVFLATAPLLSPVIVLLALEVLGPGYLLIRIVAAAVVAAVAAVVVAPHVRPPASGVPPAPLPDTPAGGRSGTTGIRKSTPGCPVPDQPAGGPRVLDAAGATALSLAPYVLYGVVVGAAVAALVPADVVRGIARTGVLSLAASTVVGLPMNLCAGEEVLLIAPLVDMGLPMGHALAFSLAGTGICAGSVPLLVAVVGRRATLLLVAVYLTVPFLLGLLLNLWTPGA